MQYPLSLKFKMLTLVLLSVATFTVNADETETSQQLKKLQLMVEQLQQQRLEQDKQIELLTKELVGIENQVSQVKIVKSEEKGTSKGNPIYGGFKDGLTFEDGTGSWKLQLNGRIQADYRNFDESDWKTDTYSIRRARFGGTFNFLKDFAVRVEGEYANDNTGARGTTALTYGYIDFTRWPAAKIRAGQFKPFFGLERPQSTNFTDFTELSLATNNGAIFNSTYDRGVMVYGDPMPWLNYNLFVINGTGQNNDEFVDNTKDTGGRINANFAALADVKNAVIHVGASASTGTVSYANTTATSISQVTEGNGAQFFNVAGLQNKDADRDRWGLETALTYGPVKFQSEYIHTSLDGIKTGAPGAGAYDNDINAWYANIAWMVTGESYADSYKSGVFGRIRPKNNFDDKDGWGAFELALRYSKFDASDFSNMLSGAAAGRNVCTICTSEADAWTAGAKWIMNPNARLVLNYIDTNFDTPIRVNNKNNDEEKAVVLRAQYDF